jgi:hypothetical protein
MWRTFYELYTTEKQLPTAEKLWKEKCGVGFDILTAVVMKSSFFWGIIQKQIQFPKRYVF